MLLGFSLLEQVVVAARSHDEYPKSHDQLPDRSSCSEQICTRKQLAARLNFEIWDGGVVFRSRVLWLGTLDAGRPADSKRNVAKRASAEEIQKSRDSSPKRLSLAKEMSPRGVEPLPAAGDALKHWKAAILPLNYRPCCCRQNEGKNIFRF